MTYVCSSTDDERSEIRNNTESWSFPPRYKAMTNTTQVSNSLSFSLKNFLTKNKAFLHFSITCVYCLQWLFWGQILFLSVIKSSSVTVQLLFYYLFFSCAKQKHILLILRFSKSAHNRKLVLVGLLNKKKTLRSCSHHCEEIPAHSVLFSSLRFARIYSCTALLRTSDSVSFRVDIHLDSFPAFLL